MSASLVLVCVILCGANPADSEPRRFHDINRELTAALRSESLAQNASERAAAVRSLVALFTELDRDPRLLTSPGLQGHRARARGRLVSVRKELLLQIARAEKAAPRSQASAALNHRQTTLLAATADAEQHALAAQLAADVSLANYALGGPASFVEAAAAAGGGPVNDHGEELVDLITRTLFPDSWEVNGGRNTIVYYRPLMCLVVTATGDVHRDVDHLLNALR